MSTVAVQIDFSGRGTVQIGTNGLHGCTVVTLVSKRGVWMTHFWQGYASKSCLPRTIDLQPGNFPLKICTFGLQSWDGGMRDMCLGF